MPRTIEVISRDRLHVSAPEVYAEWREKAPVIQVDNGAYLVLRQADMVALLNDQQTRQAEADFLDMRGVGEGPLRDFFENILLLSNGDKHKRRRAPLARTFAFKAITALRPRIRQIVDDLLSELLHFHEIEMTKTFSSVLPARVIADMIGLPESDIPEFTSTAYKVAKAFSGSWGVEDLPDIENAVVALERYVEIACASRDKTADTFLNSYLREVEQSSDLCHEEMIAQLMALVLGGSDTTRAALTIQLALLLEHRDQWVELVCAPELVASAVAESLRYEPSVASLPRVGLRDLDLDDCIIPSGKPISLVTMSAMRDPQAHVLPDQFDIHRPQEKWHWVFGGGAHRCLGEALARTELEEALHGLIRTMPKVEKAGPNLVVKGFSGIRSVEPFVIAW
ncbi:cytochrome P450 [Oryzifoliimicrobium ureilyticus]|uniref:cytochrome P450 n=1 Tax=Oryzifoliimicrobium ureilyticus TaxID=3113724 RepID=UPI00307610D9